MSTLALLPAGPASAHPLGNFTVNRYDGLVAAPGQLRVDHVEDLAEIPATQAAPDLKRLGTAAWARQRCARAAAGSRLTVDGRTAPLTAVTYTARLRPGQAGLHTLRVECRLTAPLPRGRTVALGFHSAEAVGGPGWREITARGDRMTLTAADVPKTSVSHELTTYPKDLLSSPADTTTASVRLRPGGPALAEERQPAPGAAILPRGADRWTRALDGLVARRHLSPGFAALALLVAVVLGALHALAPGHGKTLMAAAAAARGGRARPRDVLPLAASVTVTHTLGVVALGLLVTAGSAATPSVIAWLGIAGGALVLVAGANLVRRVWPARRQHTPHAGEHTRGGHTHSHSGHSHSQSHSHADHTPGSHSHSHANRTHGGHTHTHGGHTHTHPTAPTLRGTILLGFAGGLVPSPSAVVVLVGAAALGKAWFGLLLVVAYGAGLALTLTAAGFAVVRLGSGVTRVLERRPRWTAHPLAALVRRSVPLASALVVMALGAGLVLKGAASALG
ncbi:sulfite exporter TauE/SafE family protein [Streptomyces sp. NPDC046759]|uniref:HoxN/HupN/NixA family nickel/cobalt transporter n=1 Tax=Streptomyces sp. NPDC046759 TaxID=3155019 RepID=UPI0033D5AB7F